MPIKSDSQLRYSLDGVFVALKEIQVLNPDNIPDDDVCFTAPLDDMKIHIVNNRSYRSLMRSWKRLFPTPFDKSNNWLRMHGYPMNRKVR